MKKVLGLLVLGSLLLVGCSSTPKEPEVKKVYESVTLPHVILDEDSDIVDENGNMLRSEFIIRSVTVRDLTDDENEYFFEKVGNSTTLDLNTEYQLIEVDFGEAVILSRHSKPEKVEFLQPKIILGDEILYDIQYLQTIKEVEWLDSVVNGKKMGVGEDILSRKDLLLVKKSALKKGVQLRLSKDIYLDLDLGK